MIAWGRMNSMTVLILGSKSPRGSGFLPAGSTIRTITLYRSSTSRHDRKKCPWNRTCPLFSRSPHRLFQRRLLSDP